MLTRTLRYRQINFVLKAVRLGPTVLAVSLASLPGNMYFSNSAAKAASASLTNGACLPRDEMIKQLGTEGQYPLIIQEIVGFSGKTGDLGTNKEVFTSSADLKSGLHIEVVRGNYCITGILDLIKLFSSLSDEFDESAYIRSPSERDAGTLDHSLHRAYLRLGFVPLLQARSISSGNILTVVGSPEGSKKGAVFISSQAGYLNEDGRYDVINVSYGKLAKENLERLAQSN